MIPKGWRAREQAAEERRKRRLVSPEIRAARAALLNGEPVPAPDAEAEKANDTETTDGAAKARAAKKPA